MIESDSDRLLEFNRFAVDSKENFPVTACALLKAAMAVQIEEKISLILGEIRSEHTDFYKKFLCMEPSSISRSDGILPGKYHLVTGRPLTDINRLREKTRWMVPDEKDLNEWKKSSFLSFG